MLAITGFPGIRIKLPMTGSYPPSCTMFIVFLVLSYSRLCVSGNTREGVKVDSVRPEKREVTWCWPLSTPLS